RPPTPPPAGPRGGWLRPLLIVLFVGLVGHLTGWGVVAMILAIVVSIFLHELGHFLVAKRSGMKVTEFFIGFGPKIWSFRRGETEYGVKVLPAGAYVRIIGMSNLEQVDEADERRTYRAMSYPRRLATVLAGPFANFAIALVLIFVVFAGFGERNTGAWVVDGVLDGSAAAAGGIRPGDRVVSINGSPVGDWDSLGPALATTLGQPTEVVVDRGGEQITLEVVPGWRMNEVGAAALPPLRDGDRIASVDGERVASYQAFVERLGSARGTVRIEFERGPGAYWTEVQAPVALPPDGAAGFLGIVRGPAPAERVSLVEAAGRTVPEFGSIVVQSVKGVGKVFSPEGLRRYAELVTTSGNGDASRWAGEPAVHSLDPSGPQYVPEAQLELQESRPISIIGITRLGAQAAQSGMVSFLWTLIIVNIFLGMFNLLPLPPLDGGHAMVATYEAVRGRLSGRRYRVDMSKLMPVTYTVIILLVGLGLTSMYLDVVNPVPNPFGP
ncbi:M50 family metallopeptidase, partial [Rhabdothermincola sp.]|uniref:M50 family metallopeptidase n=1 Tax=Rhabdothermincola sp. TaxID=2820405 RepID=UPI002FDFF715